MQRVFVLNAKDVAKEVPAYGKFVANEVAKLGRNHPFVKTQYYSEEIDAEGGMFPAARIALMKGEHSAAVEPEKGKLYAFLLDLAGVDESAQDGTSIIRRGRRSGRRPESLRTRAGMRPRNDR